VDEDQQTTGSEAWRKTLQDQQTAGGEAWCKTPSRTLSGMRDLYAVGQQAGAMSGLPMTIAAAAGHNLVKGFCRRDRRPVVTSVPPN